MASNQALSIGVCGGGVGGLCVAIGLISAGHRVTVYEQSNDYSRIGADVNLTPNAVAALDGLCVGDGIRAHAARPTHRISRTWDTGKETSRLPMSDAAEEKYGAPQLTVHRADLLTTLLGQLDPATIKRNCKIKSIESLADSAGAVVYFHQRPTEFHDLIIGADGIHSAVRQSLFGDDHPEFTGLVSFRSVIARHLVDVPDLDAFTKWWGPTSDSQVVVFPLTRGKEVFIFATIAQEDWREESWTMPGDISELQTVYADYHPDVQTLLSAVTHVTKSALYVREPMSNWSSNSATLLGDAAHPMVPFMAQGACMAIEDAVVLTRCLSPSESGDLSACLDRYQNARLERTAKIQAASRANEWLKGPGNADWVYGYQAWHTAI